MGSRGPNKLGSDILAARGSRLARTREREEGRKAPERECTLMPPPEWLSPHAMEIWDKYQPILRETYTKGDEALLGTFCETLALFVDASKAVTKDGLTITTAKGLVKNPLLASLSQCRDSLLRMCDALGLSPAGRSRLQISDSYKEKEPDELDELLKLNQA